jgi:hypothetical protein
MKALFPFFLIAALAISSIGFAQQNYDTIYAVVNGNQVSIHQDNAQHNCAFTPIPGNLTLNGYAINWYQVDTIGMIAVCGCFFDYSVDIDSLPQGNYTVNVYSAINSLFTPDTVYEGSAHFTVNGPYQCDNSLELSSYNGPCHEYDGIKKHDRGNDYYIITQNPAGMAITGMGSEQISSVILSNLSGQEVLRNNYDPASVVYVSTSGLSKGFYIITINDGQKAKTNRKVVIK